MKTQEFRNIIWKFAKNNTRTMPWRENFCPYHVLVSEIMLQQTQVARVVPKFEQFITRYPDIQSLAHAPLSDVLVTWGGLGYNRRAKFLWQAASKITDDYGGVFPRNKAKLAGLPGVGPNTTGAIMAYAFNQPDVFIETNIRSVFFEHFFSDQSQVNDKELYKKVEETLDREHPREWYWALMDYGSYLKKNGAGRLMQSSHYKKQKPLDGSIREMRGRIIKVLGTASRTEKELKIEAKADERFSPALRALISEQLVKQRHGVYSLA
jgi:A/G-specific adenine glycosylase